MDVDYYNGTEPVYKTYDFLKKKKITYTFWDTIEPSKSIIDFKKSIQFKHDKPIKYFIYKNTRNTPYLIQIQCTMWIDGK